MNNQDDLPDLSNSLLRRLLNEESKEHEPRAPDDDVPMLEIKPLSTDVLKSPVQGHTFPAPKQAGYGSPMLPSVENAEGLPPDSEPELSLPDKQSLAQMPLREQMQLAEDALIYLRRKMANIAAEFAAGTLNQAQFDAIYSRYSEKRDITERLLARNPASQAWQSVVQPGHTSFLKQQFEAHVLSYAIYDQDRSDLIAVTGPVQLERGQVQAVLTRLKTIRRARGNPGPAQKRSQDGRCVLFVPGELTIAVVIFSLEPSVVQVNRVQDIHRDFERANQHALRNRDYTSERLVFPHRALFEENA